MVTPFCLTVATCYNNALTEVANHIQCQAYGKLGIDGLSKAVNFIGSMALAWLHYNHMRSSDKLTLKNNSNDNFQLLHRKVVKEDQSVSHITIIVVALLCSTLSFMPNSYSNYAVIKTISDWSLEIVQKCLPSQGPAYYIKNMVYPIAINANDLTYNVRFSVIFAGITKVLTALATLLGTGLLVLKNSSGPQTPFKAYPLKIILVALFSAAFMALGLYQIIMAFQTDPTKSYLNQIQLCNKAANTTFI